MLFFNVIELKTESQVESLLCVRVRTYHVGTLNDVETEQGLF